MVEDEQQFLIEYAMNTAFFKLLTAPIKYKPILNASKNATFTI